MVFLIRVLMVFTSLPGWLMGFGYVAREGFAASGDHWEIRSGSGCSGVALVSW
jgi:hypothetical protein